jgi:hypothetical protein
MGLVTPASGRPEVDQGLTKRSLNTLVQNAVKPPQSVKAVVKTIERKSINCQQVKVYQSRRKITPDSPV